MKESFELSVLINARPNVIYEAWLSSEQHSKMTGGEAECGNKIDDTFTAWDGYISGRNIELIPNQEIVQTWRTAEFADDDEDSILRIVLRKQGSGTELTLLHKNIPEGQTQYEQGWQDHYFEPMKNYFKGKNNSRPEKPN